MRLHGIVSQRAVILTALAVRTWNLNVRIMLRLPDYVWLAWRRRQRHPLYTNSGLIIRCKCIGHFLEAGDIPWESSNEDFQKTSARPQAPDDTRRRRICIAHLLNSKLWE